MAPVQSVDDKAVFVFVSDASAHHSEWLESVSSTDRHGCDAVDFCNLSGCEQLMRCPTNIAGNRLDLVMTDLPDIVDVVVGIPLTIADPFFVSCVLRVEQSVPEYNVRSTVFLKHRINWDNVCSAVRSFTFSTALKPADPLIAFDRAIVNSMGRYVPTTVLCIVDLETSNRLMPAAGELIIQNRRLIMSGVEHAMLNIEVNLCSLMLRPRRFMVLQGSCIMSAPGTL